MYFPCSWTSAASWQLSDVPLFLFVPAFVFRNDVVITLSASSRRRTDEYGWLNITRLESSDSGRYTCRVATTASFIASFSLAIEGKLRLCDCNYARSRSL